MKIGSLLLPEGPLILFLSILVALGSVRCLVKDTPPVERLIYLVVVFGLLVARLIFVLSYLPAYQATGLFGVLDIRDRGFDLTAGAIAGGGLLAWWLFRKRALRKPLLVAAAAGVVTWSTATVGASIMAPVATLPAMLLADSVGNAQPLARGDGKPMVVNLWATWCPPCRAEMPALAAAQKAHPELNVVFVNQAEPPEVVQAFLEDHDVRIQNLMYDARLSLARATGVKGYPTTLFYDAEGRLVSTHIGGFSRATFEDAIRRAYPSRTKEKS